MKEMSKETAEEIKERISAIVEKHTDTADDWIKTPSTMTRELLKMIDQYVLR